MRDVWVALKKRCVAYKAMIMVAAEVAAEEDGLWIGRIRLRHIQYASSPSLLSFVKDGIETSSAIHTAGWDTCR
jgi:hypothetical protein